ncbi:MAG: thiosulfohydrolase SoxB [Candidatus Rokubacteria bacterium 13_1_40CM_69_27]|nr:MAG: thiosulfohydrolase SoxB [Candidatus Rokubacteria bacterium 13_1_40CM_69_27]OLC31533.1 MAG: thiosulfohydrolase SoxB [Candidatus Rokubacteria bacterium 13_1_40CM_4_69_5]OLE38918.1 MAG: thiosulfohydrolase SoxB [Candidatus Rokubacteria bacterium 13_1_20CM_2_70_7]
MEVTRRDLLKLLAIAGGLGLGPRDLEAAEAPARLLEFAPLGNVTLLHMTDPHAALRPVFYREPDALLGVGAERGQPPYLTGEAALRAYGLRRGTPEAYAYTHLDFSQLAARYGRMGGYAHLATLVKRIRGERRGRTLLLDGGDTIQGSATALWTRGADMVRAMNELGVEVFTPHWEFIYGIDRVRELFGDRERGGLFAGDFVAHNVTELGFGDPIFRPYTIRAVGGVRVGVIGQAFPYTPVSHPRRFVPDLTFGIRDDHVQGLVNELRDGRKAEVVVLLSHNGIAVDLKLAARVSGLDVILGGHTHDALVEPIRVGRTLVVNSGSHGKFLSRLDLDVRGGRIADSRYRLIPVLSKALPEDSPMARLIHDIRAPHEARLSERLAVSESLLYRRGNFNGPFDEVILDALLGRADAQVAFSPGFRWGVTILPGQEISLEDVYSHTALTYANTWVREMSGGEIHRIMEDVADNLFHPDPYYRQGGDMVRLGGLTYVIDPERPMGQRITDVRVGGRPLDPARRYKATGWASLGEADGPPVWDVVAEHLRRVKRVRIDPRARVKVVSLARQRGPG